MKWGIYISCFLTLSGVVMAPREKSQNSQEEGEKSQVSDKGLWEVQIQTFARFTHRPTKCPKEENQPLQESIQWFPRRRGNYLRWILY